MPKYIVYEAQLDQLLSKCLDMGCHKPVIMKDRATWGTMVKYTIECLDGHVNQWRPQPLLGNQPIGNIAIASSIVVTRNSYSKMHAFSQR